MPCLAYLHMKPQLSGEIVGCLDHTYNNDPIVSSPGRWFILQDDVQWLWRQLKVTLDGIQCFLIIGPQSNHCNNLNYGKMPSDCRYLQLQKKQHTARYCAIKSCNMFFLLAVLCSFSILFYRTGHWASSSIPRWHNVLIAKGCNLQWIQLLKQTFICDFAPGTCMAGYIHANTSRTFPLIWALLN